MAPVAALDPAFFDLRTGVAGEVVQKATNHRLRLAVLGGVGEAAAASSAFAALVAESARGGHLWFVADDAALEERLASTARV